MIKKIDKSLFIKGFAMGAADIVPGVSGGTVALITGVYDRLIMSISSVNKDFLKLILSLKFKEAFEHINISFLLPLVFGILTAIISMAKIMHFLLESYTVYTWSLFFGLIAASILFVYKQVEENKNPKNIGGVLLGAFLGYAIVSLVPVSTPDTLPMVFFSGFIAICAMILPGISGSFILLILGKYLFITSAIKNPFSIDNILILGTFCVACLCGLLSFSRILNFLLAHYRSLIMSILTGFMIGSLKKIWPWKEILETTIIRGKTKVLRDVNIMPEFGQETWLGILAMCVGFGLILLIEKKSSRGVSSAG